MITPGTVGVTEGGAPTKQIDNVALNNPNAEPVERQIVSHGDPEVWDDIAKVTGATPAANAKGLVVRPVTDNYDSGLVDIGDTLAAVTAVTTKVSTILVINDATTLRHLTLKDGAGTTYFTDLPLQAKQVLPLAFGGAEMASGVSMQVKSGQAAGLRVHVIGRQ